ncbi:MAG: D-2-hydroxyacid dehydrogenase [Sphaerochaetaceae bacterium]|jgi:glycerate dehydrogenase|nr:D-2-hydroxyacid dehydrogenase [Sphaerochaetaceae bacterium]
MHIVVLDGYTENPGDLSWEGFASMGDLTVHERTPEELILPRIGNAEVVIINKVPITRATIEASPALRYIGVLATGYNVVDIEAAREHGVVVTNIPSYGTAAVAQFTIALLLELCHHIGHHDRQVHAGRWTDNPDFCFWDHPLVELEGKTMGILGYGRIGQRTARIAIALGMRVLFHRTERDPSQESELCRYAELDELLSHSDVISLHMPLTGKTKGIINRESIARMKDGVLLVNTSRGPLIVEEDLFDALESGKVAGAAVDVVSGEPITHDNPLLRAKHCIITPHIAWAPLETRRRLMDIAVGNLRSFLAGKPEHVVNP